MSEIKIFDNREFGSVRVVNKDGEPWFVASDVAKALGYANPQKATNDHCKKVNKFSQSHDSLGTPPLMLNIIPETDVYRLIMRSNLPSAEKFQDWVCEEVLPAIRKTGMYGKPMSYADALRAYADEVEARERAELERDHAIRTKAEIGSRREATAMATASVAVRRVDALENELGRGKRYRQVKAIPWLQDVFLPSKGMYSAVGKALKRLSNDLGYRIEKIPSVEFPDGINAYHVDVVAALYGELNDNPGMLDRYRIDAQGGYTWHP